MQQDSHIYKNDGYLNEDYHYFHLHDSAGQEKDYHFHEFDKMVILLSGKVKYLTEDREYELCPWSIFCVRHHEIHKAMISTAEPYDRVVIYLNPQFPERILHGQNLNACFDKTGENPPLLLPDRVQCETLAGLFEEFEQHQQDGELGATALRDTVIVRILILVNRIAAKAAPEYSENHSGVDLKIARALSYINEDPGRELSVDTLSEQVYLSRYHFMRLFKEETGMTVHAYVRQKRLLYAARLIRSGVPAVRAATECGFTDYSAFHRAFTETFGLSPGKLKNT